MTSIPELEFTEQELRDYANGVEGAHRAIASLLSRAERTAEEFCDAAHDDREGAVGQGMLRVAMRLNETIQGAPIRIAALARRKTEDGNSPSMEGFV